MIKVTNSNIFRYYSKSNINNAKTTEELLLKSNKPVILDINIRQSWNTHIVKYINKDLDKTINERNKNGEFEIIKVDFDQEYELIKKLKVLKIPTILGYSNGNKINEHTSYHSFSKLQIHEFLDTLKNNHNNKPF